MWYFVQVKLENVTIAIDENTTKSEPDEFVSFDETGITVRFGPKVADNDYDCKYELILNR